jgi:hypothetical protein
MEQMQQLLPSGSIDITELQLIQIGFRAVELRLQLCQLPLRRASNS